VVLVLVVAWWVLELSDVLNWSSIHSFHLVHWNILLLLLLLLVLLLSVVLLASLLLLLWGWLLLFLTIFTLHLGVAVLGVLLLLLILDWGCFLCGSSSATLILFRGGRVGGWGRGGLRCGSAARSSLLLMLLGLLL